MDAIKAILERRSVRKFSDQTVSKEMLEGLVECGRLAPTGHNKQGRSFVVLTERSTIDEVGKIATWAKFVIGKAPAIILVFCDTKECATFVEDGAAATENILIAATAQGLGSCWMAGYGMPYAKEIEALANASESKKLISIIALGYPSDTNTPMPKKSSLNEVIVWDKF
ncbi:nitroreductase family protein [Clostridium sp. P21]|uniref:Nitroreductase family protein n=1 Tax=Clostridium muellerianum TaxID=2716538 RepID=A0A7Y0HQ44_9CLOT|nr:nitroreductase family protein [Clostridium muellerianum]NMM63363.1 nitroreductase family protein [Clostridium muellerianum]